MGEIFEHILNAPKKLLENVRRKLKDEGILILTTPNPSTIMNAIKILTSESYLRGTWSFAETIKFQNGRVTADSKIHYREYTTRELTDLLVDVGFQVDNVEYLPVGGSHKQSYLRVALKIL
jgi:2-polyprenyl-3-methyl-5-hydroxy-6-metoxy-1,4-benzoquinol methylase